MIDIKYSDSRPSFARDPGIELDINRKSSGNYTYSIALNLSGAIIFILTIAVLGSLALFCSWVFILVLSTSASLFCSSLSFFIEPQVVGLAN